MKEAHIKMLMEVRSKLSGGKNHLGRPAKPQTSDTKCIAHPQSKPQPTMKQIMAAWTIQDWRNAK